MSQRIIKIKVWDKKLKTMSTGMVIPMLAGYLTAKYSEGKDLGDFEYLESTGLTDSKGREIFESDILKYEETCAGVHSESLYTVEWGEGGFYLKSSEDNEYNMEAHSSFTQGSEVLGNVHESPELLKEK